MHNLEIKKQKLTFFLRRFILKLVKIYDYNYRESHSIYAIWIINNHDEK